jgi:MFS family permease
MTTNSRLSAAWALTMLTAIYTCGFVDRIMLQILVEPIKREFLLSDTQIALLGGLAFASLNVLLGLWFARIAERRSRVTMIAIGTALWSLATAACGMASSFVQLFAARIGVGVGEAIGLPATSSVIADLYPRASRTTALSVMWIATPLGSLIGAAGIAWISQSHGWRMAFIAAAIPGLILALILHVTVPEPRRGQHDSLSAEELDHVPTAREVFHRMWTVRSLRHILSGSTIAATAAFGLNAFVAAWLMRRFGLTIAQAGMIMGLINSGPILIGVVGSGLLSDRLGKKNQRVYGLIPGIALLIAAPLYMIAVTRDQLTPAIVLLAAAAPFQYSYLASYSGTLQNMMHPRMRATAVAGMSVIVSLLSATIGPLLVGLLSDHLAAASGDAAIGLGRALALTSTLYFWAAVHLLWSTRDLVSDLATSISTDRRASATST